MSVSLADIAKLREQTGVGVGAAKQALEAAAGDVALAVDHLRRAGERLADAKQSRQVKDGVVALAISPDHRRGAMVAVACETDFVARTPDFQRLAQALADELLRASADRSDLTPAAFLGYAMNGGTVADQITTAIGKLGEKVELSSLSLLIAADGRIGTYLHSNRKLGAMVGLTGSGTAAELAHELALHVAAANPQYVRPEDVPPEVVERERSIYRAQLERERKPAAMVDRIITGKLERFYAETCLTHQPFVKDEERLVGQLLTGGQTVSGFVRLML